LTALGNTNIAYSPNFIAGNIVTFLPVTNFQVHFLSKIVGEQYMGNIDSEGSKLKSYFVNDLNVSYEFTPKSVFKSILLTGLVILITAMFQNYTYDDNYSDPNQITNN
jgi:iron complex outermembrane receptor protein